MGAHQQARREIESLAAEIAPLIVQTALPSLKQKYDAGAREPSTVAALDSSVGVRVLDQAGDDLELGDEIFLIVHEKAVSTLMTQLGQGCHNVTIYRHGSHPFRRGEDLQFDVRAFFS